MKFSYRTLPTRRRFLGKSEYTDREGFGTWRYYVCFVPVFRWNFTHSTWIGGCDPI